MFYTGLANFDSAVFNKPFQFILGRKNKPLYFGTGMHKCIGQGIALNFATSFIANPTIRNSLQNIDISGLAGGVAALGASHFNIGVNHHE